MNKETRIAKQDVTVEIQNVTKTFGKHIAVDDLSLTVPQGSIYGFIGPNGSGKTTTLRMIMGIIYPDSGAIRVFGEDVYGGRSDRIGYLPEERGLYKNMKVREILQFYGELKSGRNVTKEVDRWLERFDLNDWANKKVEMLILPWFFAYMLMGIVMFGAILTALGSACNDAKDAQSLNMPAMLPVIISMFLIMPVLREPQGNFATWLSLFPPFTPTLMLLRQSTPAGVPLWQAWGSLIGLLVFTVLSVWAGGRIFRVGILMQGKPPRLSDILRWAIRG